MSELRDLLLQLEEILSKKAPSLVRDAEECLAQIVAVDDPRSIEPLLKLMDDSAPDELMFSIVHAVERWDDEQYSDALLRSAADLLQSAPRWAQILHIRVMNSSQTSSAYFEKVAAAPPPARSAVRATLDAVAKNWPQVAAKASALLASI